MNHKIVKWINKEVIHSDLIISNALLLSGGIIFSSLISDEKIGGKYYPLILIICYFVLGIGMYGIFKWLLKYGFRLLIFFIRLLLFGNIEMTVTKKKVSFKTHYKK